MLMTKAAYARHKGVSRQTVYDRMAENNQDQILILNQKLSEFVPSMPHTVGSNGY
ncbi:hypothetical protein [Enterobacter cloacae]|uniref:hypothetical protein n=1 Tax=Enterobacter cloacae TaxID=550 RepID=UPI0012B7A2B3|nr:hypothetical protein [Enterobacter cloacae]